MEEHRCVVQEVLQIISDTVSTSRQKNASSSYLKSTTSASNRIRQDRMDPIKVQESRLAYPSEHHRRPLVLRLHQLLSMVVFGLLQHRETMNALLQKDAKWVWVPSRKALRTPEDGHLLFASPSIPTRTARISSKRTARDRNRGGPVADARRQ